MTGPEVPGAGVPDEPDEVPARHVLVVPSPDPRRLAVACAGLGLHGFVAPAGGPCVVVLASGSDADAAAQRISRVLGRAPVLLLTRDDGHVAAQRWVGGALADTPQAGLLVASLPDAVTAAVVGPGDPGQIPGAVRIALRPGSAMGAGGRPSVDPGRLLRRRGIDRLAAWLVCVVAALFAAVEGLRAAGGEGSWVAVVLALLVSAGAGLLAARLGAGGRSPDGPAS